MIFTIRYIVFVVAFQQLNYACDSRTVPPIQRLDLYELKYENSQDESGDGSFEGHANKLRLGTKLVLRDSIEDGADSIRKINSKAYQKRNRKIQFTPSNRRG